MKRKKSLYNQMLVMTILPVVLMGCVIMLVCFNRFQNTMYQEVKRELQAVAKTINKAYDDKYPGDYSSSGDKFIAVYKGNTAITSKNEYIDYISEHTGIEISMFYGTLRFATTIKDVNGVRLEGTTAHVLVKKEVLETGKGKLYTNVEIGNNKYFNYYEPLVNSDGKVVGMMGLGKPMTQVQKLVIEAVLPILIVVLIFTIVVGLIVYRYASRLIGNIKNVEKSLRHIAAGDFSKDEEGELIEREDELGQIGRELRDTKKELRRLLEYDGLTRLYNRTTGQKKLEKIYGKAKTTGISFVLVMADIDYFKQVNDTYGHEAGDVVLKGVAEILNQKVRKCGYASRFGGEEFLLVFENVEFDRVITILEDIRNEVEKSTFQYSDKGIGVTMTMGVEQGDPEKSIDELIKGADDKLYAGKTGGRNRIIQ